MIELLVQYILDKGYQVDVRPRHLKISRLYGDEVCAINWMIPKCDLQPEYEGYLHDIADRYCYQIEQAITERVRAA